MKIGTWWCVFDSKGRARGVGEDQEWAWHLAWKFGRSAWPGSDELKKRMEKRGWTCELVEIRRPK